MECLKDCCFCSKCGEKLNFTMRKNSYEINEIFVDFCLCNLKEYKEGYGKGYDEGYDDGHSEGYNSGQRDAHS